MTSSGTLLRLIRDGTAVTRADMARHTGLARSTVTQRLEALLAHELVYEAGGSAPTGGRPATLLRFNPGAGVVLVADVGVTAARVAVSDLSGAILTDVAVEVAVTDGAEVVLQRIDECFGSLLGDLSRTPHDVRGLGIGVPGPVAANRGAPVAPPLMPGWDGFSIREWFGERYSAPVFVDNDANFMALGEHWTHWRDTSHLLFIKMGDAIGSGIVTDGKLHRGAQGTAGDIGHLRIAGHDDVGCRCGNDGCLEAVAGGHALADRLGVRSSRDVVALVRAGEPAAIRAVRDAGRQLGEAVALCLNFFNPHVIVVGGELAEAHQPLLAGLRETIFQRSLPLATDDLRIKPSQLREHAGVIGAARMVTERVLTPEAVDQALQAA